MSRTKKGKKGMHPAVAVGLFVVCGGIAAKQFLGMGAAPPPASVAGGDEAVAVDEGQAAQEREPVAVDWQDLLAKHGSFARDSNVQLAFVVVEDAVAAAPLAAPAAEVETPSADTWRGADPPALRLGVVMLSGASRRAVLGGRVVGIGDAVGDAKVRAIEPGKVVVAWGSRTLTYQLDSDVAVEFRAEAARREAERKAAEPAPGAGTAAHEDADDADASPAEVLERVRAAAAKAGAGTNQSTTSAQSPAKSQPKSKSKSNPQSQKKEEGQ